MSGFNNLFSTMRRRGNDSEKEDEKDNDPVTNDREDLMEDDDDDLMNSDFKASGAKTKRPKENAFTQQKLKAVHPILTASTVVPLFVVLAVIFIPIGAAMLKASENVQDMFIDYAYCSELASKNYWSQIPSDYYTKRFKSDATIQPQWRLATNDSFLWDDYPEEQNICQIQFQIPNTMKAPIYFFYMLTNFNANHRRYVSSFSEDQLNGKKASESDIKDTIGQNCQPLSTNADGKIYYPCGLIANSFFNDTFSSTLSAVNDTSASDYVMSNSNIAWSTNKNRFKKTQYDPSTIVPPQNWVKQFPDGYNSTNIPDISTWEEFQNWMAPAALSDFSKMALRNDNQSLEAGIYQVDIGLHFPTTEYSGGKKIYITTRSAIGGKNSFLGIAWIVGGAICLVLAIIVLFGVAVKGRRSGDTALLSWNN